MTDEATNHLRVRVVDDQTTRSLRRIEVLDKNDRVVGDLAGSVAKCEYEMGITGLSVIKLEIAAERVSMESIEVPGMNAPAKEA